MTLPAVWQPAFVAGELAPTLWGRQDLAAYFIGARTLRNWVVLPQGGISRRPGTRYLQPTLGGKVARLVPFVFNVSQSYALEFTDLKMRIYRQGGIVLYPAGDPNEGDVVEVTTPYAEADLAGLRWAQSADVLYLVHPSHAPRMLTRTDHHAWTLTTMSFTPSIAAPTGLGSTVESTTDARTWYWVVTAISETTGEESLPSAGHSASAGITAVKGVKLAWTGVTGANAYNIYRAQQAEGPYGYVGTSYGDEFTDIYDPDYSDTPPTGNNPFSGADKYPSHIAFFQGRLCFARTNDAPQTVWMSQSGAWNNFKTSRPPRDSDAIEVTIASRQIDEIRGLVPLRVLLVLTAGAEHSLTGAADETITPPPLQRVESYRGAADVSPITVGEAVLYVARDQRVRALSYSLELDGYSGDDLSARAVHLLEGTSVREWAYQQTPASVIWIAREDGGLVAFTLDRQQQVLAWHSHETAGTVESLVTIPEASGDALYLVVNRANGRGVERLASDPWTDLRSAVYLDAALCYDGRHTGSETLTLTGAAWTHESSLTCTATADTFTAGMVGGHVVLPDPAGGEWRGRIETITDARTATVTALRDVPAALQGVAVTGWGIALARFAGLEHLEDLEVLALVDGDEHAPLTVDAGAVTLDRPGLVVCVGLAYTSRMESLDVLLGRDGSRTRPKYPEAVTLMVNASRGLRAAQVRTERAEEFVEFKPVRPVNYDEPLALEQGQIRVALVSGSEEQLRVAVEAPGALPATILAAGTEVGYGG